MQKGDVVRLVKNYTPATVGSAAGSPPFQGESEVTYLGTSRRGGYTFARLKGGACYPVTMLDVVTPVSRGGEGSDKRVFTGGPRSNVLAGAYSQITVGESSRVWAGPYSKVKVGAASIVIVESGSDVEAGGGSLIHIIGSAAKVKTGANSIVFIGTQRYTVPGMLKPDTWYHISTHQIQEAK